MKKELFRIKCADIDKHVLENTPINQYAWGEVITRLAKKYPDASTIDHMGECEYTEGDVQDETQHLKTELNRMKIVYDKNVEELRTITSIYDNLIHEYNTQTRKTSELVEKTRELLSELSYNKQPKMVIKGVIFRQCKHLYDERNQRIEEIIVKNDIRTLIRDVEELLRES